MQEVHLHAHVGEGGREEAEMTEWSQDGADRQRGGKKERRERERERETG